MSVESNASGILVTGASKSGKSTYVKNLIRGQNRIVVFDPLHEYAAEGFTQARSVAEVVKLIAKNYGSFRITFEPPMEEAKKHPKLLHDLSVALREVQAAYKAGKSKLELVFLVEEMSTSYPNHKIPDNLYGFGSLCMMGRHYGIWRIGVAQRLAKINTDFRGNCFREVILRPAQHIDVKAAIERLGPEYFDAVKNLQPHHFFVIEEGGKIYPGKNPNFRKGR